MAVAVSSLGGRRPCGLRSARRGRGVRHVLILRPAVATLHRTEVARLHLVPEASADLAVADLPDGAGPGRPVTLAARFLVRPDDVVLACFDGLGREEVVELVPLGALVGPLPHGLEHVLLNLDTLVANGRMVEGA